MNIVEIIYLLYSGLQGSSVWIELPSYVGANVGAFVGDGAGDWAVHSIFRFFFFFSPCNMSSPRYAYSASRGVWIELASFA